ncbi:L,D-transpeptidase family protein [Thiorhodococcus minor]|uniref:L,D-transpeptidase family protein n=1 Tax=Thiorhodococcus minor TaxID=57489 RepID=A0A6M0JVJ9_9GAMM|nr:L,D-transpeptidase family protein [Thiorhodococcus minor]NEV61209.1 L,D-transpeptidase family protein [Thiorhodococcus minor]
MRPQETRGARFASPRFRFWRPDFGLGIAAILLLGTFALSGCTTTSEPPKYTGPVERVVVKKSQRKLQLVGGGQVMREYRVALGGSPVGHKYREGDQRTPEGSYVLNWRNPSSNFHKAIHISYPSERDRHVSRQLGYSPGGMIMIHGMPNYIRSESMRRQYVGRDWTQGCIAVQNHEMDEIWRMVRDGTPIEIIP